MATTWLIAKIIAYTYVLFMLLRISNNFIFMLALRPKTWIAVTGLIGLVNMLVVFFCGWDPRLAQTAVVFACIFSIPPPAPKGMSKKEHKTMMRETYAAMGMPYGRLQYRLGLATFLVLSLAANFYLFAEACTYEGVCSPAYAWWFR